jgi:hypothetical protein
MNVSLVIEPASSAISTGTSELFVEAPELTLIPTTAEAPAPGLAPKELTAEERIWSSRKRRLARSAARAALVVPGVAEANFTIMGTAAKPSLMLTCILRPQADAAAVMEHIESTVVGDLEVLLGVPFAQRQIEFSVGRA